MSESPRTKQSGNPPFVDNSSKSPSPTAALPIQIYNYARSPYPDWQAKAWGGALVLITLIGALSLLARWAVSRRTSGSNQ